MLLRKAFFEPEKRVQVTENYAGLVVQRPQRLHAHIPCQPAVLYIRSVCMVRSTGPCGGVSLPQAHPTCPNPVSLPGNPSS